MSELIQLDNLPVETLAEMANEAAAACEASGRKTVEHAATCGRALLAIKAQLRHGEWGQWLAENFSQSHKRATQYMEIANLNARSNLESAETIQGALRMIADTPERQAKRQERESKKQEQQAQKPDTSPKPPAPAAPAPPAKPERPAWLADPDELDRPEDDLPPLPKTNTHHTTQNRRTPDARETDRAGIVCPDDPRGLQDGRLYVWSEAANRLFLATPEQVWAAAMELRPDEIRGQLVAEPAATTTPVVESTKEFVSSKPGKVPTVDQLIASLAKRSAPAGWPVAAVEMIGRWASYKQTLTAKAKIRSYEQWAAALSRMENVAISQGWQVVCDMIEKAIANGWQGWEHETAGGNRKPAAVAPHRTFTRLSQAEVKYDELPE